jgi:hypothetical protein
MGYLRPYEVGFEELGLGKNVVQPQPRVRIVSNWVG